MNRQNPFPGVNPWMQSVWHDVHTRLIAYIVDQLVDVLPADISARAEEGISVSNQGQDATRYRGDVVVSERTSWQPPPQAELPAESDSSVCIAEPVVVVSDEVVPRWVEIRAANGQLITVIEITSPANKTPEGRFDYERKLMTLVHGGVNVMEIDLVRGGRSARDHRSGDWPPGPYQIVVNRAYSLNRAEVYPVGLWEPLPAVPVPLRDGEKPVPLDLKPLYERCYSKGRYWMLPYQQAPVPPLDRDDLEQAQKMLIHAGLLQDVSE